MFGPRPFPVYPDLTPPLYTVPLRRDLPAPVARFFTRIMGETVPVINSAVLSGRGKLRLKGVTFPIRWRFIYRAGSDYRHYIEATVFGLPVMKVNEHYLNNHARLELPFGVVENSPKVDMAANLGLWGESIWLPSIYLTDNRVRWESIDAMSARLVVPFQDTEDSFTATFDPASGLLKHFDTLRFRDAADTQKIHWRNEALQWTVFNGVLIPSVAAVTWMDEGTPWLVMSVEEAVYNVDVSQYIRAKGI